MKTIVLKLIILYQKSFFLNNELFKTFFLTDQACKYEPTCSRYTYQSVEKYGVLKGLSMSFGRIIRCHPWAKGGYDPIK